MTTLTFQDFDEYYRELEADFLCYLGETSEHILISLKEHHDSENFNLSTFKNSNRWSTSYKASFLAKMFRLQEWYLLNPYPVTFLTLTTRNSGNILIEDQITMIRESWKKLLYNLRKLRPGLDYFSILDFHKNGYAHYHIVLFAGITKQEEQRIRNLWSVVYDVGHRLYGVDLSVRPRNDIRFLVSYLIKHAGKVLFSHYAVPGFLRFHSVIYYMQHSEKNTGLIDYKGVRLFGMSRRLSSFLKFDKDNYDTVAVGRYQKGRGYQKVYEKNLANWEDPKEKELYDWIHKNNSMKLDKAIKFFCDLSFEDDVHKR